MAELLNASLNRRTFLRHTATAIAGASAGLTLGFRLSTTSAADTVTNTAAVFQPNAFIHIGVDNRVTLLSKHLEMGQGIYTGLATIVSEELDAAWDQIDVVGAPADAERYNNLLFGPIQGTGNSTSIMNSWQQLREAGAAARAMLLEAAAQRWQQPVTALRAAQGVVRHPDGRQASFGELAEAAARLPPPINVTLKDPQDFVTIGTPQRRKDGRDKITGVAVYTQDIQLPEMLTAVVAHPPRFGATVRHFQADAAKALRGVVDVVPIPTGVAVLATDFWSATRGREALQIDWDESHALTLDSDQLRERYRTLAKQPGRIARQDGDTEQTLTAAATVVEASYDLPFLAHATMEPMNCVVRIDPNGCEIWNGAQLHTVDQQNIAAVLGLRPDQVKINMLYAGGSFGRRGNPYSDYLLEAVHIAKASGLNTPIKMVWTREDDMRGGYYRPMYHHTLRAGLDAEGKLIAWHHRLVGQSLLTGSVLEPFLVNDGIDSSSIDAAINLPYHIAHQQVELHTVELSVPVLWWRSVDSSHSAFAIEVFIDELAATAGRDPVVFRRELLADHPRHLAVLNLAAAKAGWARPLAAGKGRGIALHEHAGSVVAHVVEVTIGYNDAVSIDRVVCALDCGIAVNPDLVEAQMESGIGFGLTAALYGEIHFRAGRVVESNFHDYIPLRLREMPDVEVHIHPSTAPPSGVGEAGLPPLAPALVNAIAAATGKRHRQLPLRLT